MDPRGVQDIFVCGTSDKGLINKFLDNALDRAQGTVDNYVNEGVDTIVTKSINKLSVRQAVNLLYKYAREELLKKLGVIGKLPGGLSDEVIIDKLAQKIEGRFKGAAEQELRKFVMIIKDRILDSVRKKLQEQLRNILQESLTALCALAVEDVLTITIADLLKRLRENMPKYLVPALVAVMEDFLIDLAKEAATGLLYAVGAIVAIGAFILFLPEEGIGALMAGIVEAVQTLIELLPDFSFSPFQFTLNDQSQNDSGEVAMANAGSTQEEVATPSSDSGTVSSTGDTTTKEALA